MSDSSERGVPYSFMTASELMEMLTKAIDHYGDMQVRVFDTERETYDAISPLYDATGESIILLILTSLLLCKGTYIHSLTKTFDLSASTPWVLLPSKSHCVQPALKSRSQTMRIWGRRPKKVG